MEKRGSRRRGDAGYRAPDERRTAGRALRETFPRESHGGWKARANRTDPVDLLLSSSEGRLPDLLPIRWGRMIESPFAFFRGSAALMAADLAGAESSGIQVQLCGDAHLLNFGAFATPERNVVFDLNDFDETLPGPFEWDLKRLAASLVIAARHLRLSETEAARATTASIRAYREHMADYSAMRTLEIWYDRIDIDRFISELPDDELKERARARIEKGQRKALPEYLFPELAEHRAARPRIKDDPPLIFHPDAKLAPGASTGYASALERYRESLPEHVRRLLDRFHYCDAAIKVVGVGSVGTACMVMLFMAADNDPLFLQVKEATESVLEPHLGKSAYPSHGQRVVAGQRLMQSASDIFLGFARGDNKRDFYLRQLRDTKISVILEDWDAGTLRTYGRLCAWALARAHARSGDAAELAGYMGSSEALDDAVCEFAMEYADQVHRDFRTFVRAVREGRIEARTDS